MNLKALTLATVMTLGVLTSAAIIGFAAAHLMPKSFGLFLLSFATAWMVTTFYLHFRDFTIAQNKMPRSATNRTGRNDERAQRLTRAQP